MKWYYIFIAIPLALLIAQSPSARLHVIEKPTKVIGFLNVQGNIFPVWGDRYSLGTSTYVWDSVYANYLMGQIDTTETGFQAYVAAHGGGGAFDSLYVLWGTAWETQAWLKGTDTIRLDTTTYASLSQLGDTADEVRTNAQAYIEDSLNYYLLITRHNDTIAVLRGNISAYIEDSLDSYTLIATLNDTTLKMRAEMPESADVSSAAAIASFKQTQQTITATHVWDGGDVIAGDGQKFIARAVGDAESLLVYILNDTVFVVSTGLPIVIGEEGITEIGDTLVLPKWNNKGATATLGACGLDTTGTDTAWIYTQDGWKSFVPAAAGGGGSTIKWNLLSGAEGPLTKQQTGNIYLFMSFEGAGVDSIIIDSLRCVFMSSANDVYIDSVCITSGCTRTTLENAVKWGNGTNYCEGTSAYTPVSYTGINVTCSTDWRMRFYMFVSTAGGDGYGYTYNAIIYCHEQ